jgi:hypothetical protein
MGIGAHSYFRYNTHLGLLLMAALGIFLRDWRWEQVAGRWQRAMPAAIVVVALLAPLLFLTMLRFDLEVPNLRAYRLAHEAALRIANDERLLLILPGDNGTLPPTIEGVLRDLPPRRANVDLTFASDASSGLAMTDYPRALLSCAPPETHLAPAGGAALLRREGDHWRAEASWGYDPPWRLRWSQVLAPAPLCLAPRG